MKGNGLCVWVGRGKTLLQSSLPSFPISPPSVLGPQSGQQLVAATNSCDRCVRGCLTAWLRGSGERSTPGWQGGGRHSSRGDGVEGERERGGLRDSRTPSPTPPTTCFRQQQPSERVSERGRRDRAALVLTVLLNSQCRQSRCRPLVEATSTIEVASGNVRFSRAPPTSAHCPRTSAFHSAAPPPPLGASEARDCPRRDKTPRDEERETCLVFTLLLSLLRGV